jgi:multidrug efflux pump subunit AcrA (membrane-fusion protein)
MEGDALQWIHVPGFTSGDQAGSPATVRARIAGQDLPFLGKVVRTEGKLDARTRMIHVVVRVERPYAERPPLAVGLFVSVEIHGQVLDEAAIIPRIALRSGTEVWVVNDGRLKFRKVTVARVQGDKAFIKSGLKDGDLLVTSPLKAVTDGMKVRTTLSGEGREAS